MSENKTSNPISLPPPSYWLEQVRPYLENGKRVVLLREDKMPFPKGFTKAEYKVRTVDDVHGLLEWAKGKGVAVWGFGVVQGAWSKEYTLDFDLDAAKTFAAFSDMAKEQGIDVGKMYRTETGRTGGGIHLTWAMDEDLDAEIDRANKRAAELKLQTRINKAVLAYRFNPEAEIDQEPYLPLIEYKGFGRFVVKPPSIHKTGTPYKAINGEAYKPTHISTATAVKLISIAASFNEKQSPPQAKAKADVADLPKAAEKQEGAWEYDSRAVIDEYNRRNKIDDVLQRYGYLLAGSDRWQHPNKDSARFSVHVLGNNLSCHFGAKDKANNSGAGQSVRSPFGLYAIYEHGGDHKAAVKAASKEMGMDKPKAAEPPKVTASAKEPKPTEIDIEGLPQDIKNIQHLMDSQLSLQAVYDAAPEPVRRLTQLLCTLNPILPSSAQFLTALNLAGAVVGKRIEGINMGQTYYPNSWLVVLAPTGSNKSALNAVRRSLQSLTDKENVEDRLFDILPDRFTMSSLFDHIGQVLHKKDWQKLSYGQKEQEKRTLRGQSYDRPGYILFCDEWALALQQIINSGQDGGREMDRLLKLADSGADLYGMTVTGGYRAIYDCCLSVIGYTQADSWHELFEADRNLASGLIGRFFVMNIADYKPLQIEPLDLSHGECLNQIENVVKDIVEKAKRVPKRACCNFGKARGKGKDWALEIMESVLSLPLYRLFVDNGVLPIEELKGKVFYQALKYTMTDRLLRLTNKEIDGLVADGAGKVETDLLRDKTTYRRYVIMILSNLCKLFAADNPKTEQERIEERVRLMMVKAPRCKMTMRDIQRRGQFRRDRRLLSAAEVYQIVRSMEERGVVEISEGERKSLAVSLTKRGMAKA